MNRQRWAVLGGVALGAVTAWLVTAPSGEASPEEVGGSLAGVVTRATDQAARATDPGAAPVEANSRARRLHVRGPIERDPARPGYDPTKLVQMGQRAWDVFEGEPRDAEWAVPMEERLLAWAQGDLDTVGANVRVTRVECRHSTCTMTAESPEPFTKQSMFILQVLGVAPVGMVRFADEDGVSVFEQCLVFDPTTRELEDNREWYADKRARVLARHADGGEFDVPQE